MSDEKMPKGCTLVHRPDRNNGHDGVPVPRVSAEQVAMVVNCIVRDDGPRKLSLLSTTGMVGERGDEYVEFTADGYQLAAYVRGGMVTNVFYCLTPKGGEYFMPHDGGSPFDNVSIEDRKALTVAVVNSKRKDHGFEVVPCWILATNGARPYAAHLFYEKALADAALIEQIEHWKKCNRTPEEIRESQSTEKQIAKDRATVAVKAGRNGLSKQQTRKNR